MRNTDLKENKGAQKDIANSSGKSLKRTTLQEMELIAAEVLYGLANNGKTLGKRKLKYDGSSGRSLKTIKRNLDSETNVLDGSCNKDDKDVSVAALDHCPANSRKLNDVASKFSFSIIHLLSAVRAALVTPLSVELAIENKKPLHCVNRTIGDRDSSEIICHREPKNLPSLTIAQITNFVRSRPGDIRILECKEPLVELVRGALKIFSSKTTPLGITQWKLLTVYDRLSKTWRWIGSITYSLTRENYSESETSCSVWGLSEENLAKLVGNYAIWLEEEQPILHHIARLPSFPRELMQDNFHTRFNNRKKYNPATITQSCEEIRDYYHKEETIRYLIPYRPFRLTTLDGEKSTVAPLRMNSNRTLTKARGHYIFKPNRPPQFSLLSLVRDAAARLPSGMGTRADICILIRDSQYVIDDAQEKTVKQVVSGALDRLHSEDDPCVEYNGKWGLWVYLHRDRDEEDFTETDNSSVKIKDQGNS